MFRARALLFFSYILAIFTIVGLWLFLAPGAVNALFAFGNTIADGLGYLVGVVLGANPDHMRIIVTAKMNGGKMIAVGLVTLLLLVIIQRLRGRGFWPSFGSTLVALFIIHLALALLWVRSTRFMASVHEWNGTLLKLLFRSAGWDRAETLLTDIFHLQSILVMGEALIIYLFLAWLFGRMRRRTHDNKPA